MKTIKSFKYLGAIVIDERSIHDIRLRITLTALALINSIMLDNKSIELSSTMGLVMPKIIIIFFWEFDNNSRNRDKNTDCGNEKLRLAKTISQDTVRIKRRRLLVCRQRKQREDNIQLWTGLELSGLVRREHERKEWCVSLSGPEDQSLSRFH